MGEINPAPDLIGRTLAQINDEFEHPDFSILVESVESAEAKDRVFLQIPSAGADMGSGATVYLRVSKGLMIPTDILGRKAESVAEELTEAGFAVEITETQVLGVPKGAVAASVPAEGTFIDATKDAVFLKISNDEGVAVPQLVGLRIGPALETLEAIGLKGSLETDLDLRPIGSICEGTTTYTAEITSSEPSQGTYVVLNSEISLQGKKVVAFTTPGDPCSPDGIPL